jgi:hypothetical protein
MGFEGEQLSEKEKEEMLSLARNLLPLANPPDSSLLSSLTSVSRLHVVDPTRRLATLMDPDASEQVRKLSQFLAIYGCVHGCILHGAKDLAVFHVITKHNPALPPLRKLSKKEKERRKRMLQAKEEEYKKKKEQEETEKSSGTAALPTAEAEAPSLEAEKQV